MGPVLGKAFFHVGKNHFEIMGVRSTGQKSLRATAQACFVTGTMVAVLMQLGTMAWVKERLKNVGEDLSQLFCTGPKHSARDAIRAGSFMHVHQGGTHVNGGKCERQAVRCEHSFDGWLCVSTIKASINVVQFIREGGIAVWGCAVFWFIVCEGMDACPHAPRVVVFKSVINVQFVIVFS